MQGDLPREEFLKRSGAVLDTTAESLWGKGAGSAAVFREIDELDNLEKMKAARAQNTSAADTYNKHGKHSSTQSSARAKVKTGAYTGPCNSGAAVRAMETYINTKIGTSSAGRIIDVAI